jgi:zinc/manganese transport system substrate-binding protein
MRQLAILALFMLGAVAGLGNAIPHAMSQPPARPKVVATFSILGDLVHNVAGDKVELVTLVGPDSDAHVYEPKPQDTAAIADAAAIFEIGIGLEQWLDKLYKSSSSKAQRVVVSKGLKLLFGSDDENDTKDVKKGPVEDRDPHIWHDVKNTIHMVDLIRDHLATVDPANATYYRNRAFDYALRLRELDVWVLQQTADVPRERRRLVTNHDTFGYFAKRYGFEIVADALGPTSTEGAQPSPRDIAKLIAKIKAARVPVVFAENIDTNKLVKRLAEEAGVRLGPELFADALGKAGSPGETFEKMVRYNVTAIVTELTK